MKNMMAIDRANALKKQFGIGLLTYEEVTAQLKPILAEMDAEAEKIAKKYGKKHHKFSTIRFLR